MHEVESARNLQDIGRQQSMLLTFKDFESSALLTEAVIAQ